MQATTAQKLLAQNAKAARVSKELSINKLANRKGAISESTLRRIEKATKGKKGYDPKLSTLVNLSNVLGQPISVLIGQLQAIKASAGKN